MSTLDQLTEVQQRPVISFTLPAKVASEAGFTTVGLVELTAGEELMATKRCGNDPIRLAFELAKESLRVLDGRRVSTGDGTADQAWEKMHPRARNLIVRAFGEVHNPSMDDVVGFLASRQTTV